MEMFIMIFIVTVLLDVYMMVNDDCFPYDQTIADRISKVVGVVVWVLTLFIPIPQGVVEGMYALHAYLGNFRFVMLILLAFYAIAHINHHIRARWVSSWRTGFHKSDDYLMVFFSALLATMAVGAVAVVSMMMASPRFGFALILGVL
jgi:hypothetical protein